MNLSQWNPFRFTRRQAVSPAQLQSSQRPSSSQQQQQQQPQQQQQQQGQPGAGAQMGGMPQPWPGGGVPSDPARMMASMMLDPFGAFSRFDSWFGDFSPESFEPRIDVADRGDAIEITTELPGVDRKDVQITVEDGYLVISGEKKLERKADERGVYHVERAFGAFQRVVPLPDEIDASRCEANFDNGTLTIRLPKSVQPGGGRRVEIGSRASSQGSRATAA
jgi:HSP20 family protein